MKDLRIVAGGISRELAETPIEVAQSLWLLKAFLSLPQEQWPEIIERIEQRVLQQATPQPGQDEHLFS
jgi:S-methylmethionine-dependent homocysteine/selenocysteine methylase